MTVWQRLEDATSLAFPDGTPVRSAIDYFGWQGSMIMSRRIARVWHADAVVLARVNHGRWLADCSYCGQGMFTHPEWKVACCGECGAVYRRVVFPEHPEDITRLLLERPRRDTQNWLIGESTDRLLAENIEQGIAS